MFYTPTSIQTVDIPHARKHALGGEKRLYITAEPIVKLGDVLLAGDGSGVWTPDAISALPTAGADLAVVVGTELRSDAAAVVTLTGTKVGGGAYTGTATFSPPGWVANKKFHFQHGAALDLTPANPGELADAITSVAVTNAKRWSKLQIYQLPAAAGWVEVGMVEGFTPNIGTHPPIAIPDGLDGVSEVTRGRSEENTLQINAIHRSIVDGLMRYAGMNCSVRVDIWRGGNILVERHVCGNVIMSVNPDFPDGSELAKQAASGMFEQYFGFYAK